MATLNLTLLIGRLGADPEVRPTQSGSTKTNFRVATNWKGKDGKEDTTWHSVVCFAGTAEAAGKWLKKGSNVFVLGRIRNYKWTDKEGKERWGNEVVADNIQFLDPAPAKQAGAGGQGQSPAPTVGVNLGAAMAAAVAATTAANANQEDAPPPVDDDAYYWSGGEAP